MHERIALLNAGIFFLFWLAVLYAGADHPPPPGYITVVLLDLAVAGLVYWYGPVYLTWIEAQGGGALPPVVRDGLVAGLLFATVAMGGLRLLGGGEPAVTPSLPGAAIWFAVVGGVGVANALAIYLVNGAVLRAMRGH